MQNAFNPMMGFPSDRAALTADLVRGGAPAASAQEGDHAFSGVFNRLLQHLPEEPGKSAASAAPVDGASVSDNTAEGLSSDEQAVSPAGEVPLTAMAAWGLPLTENLSGGAALPTDTTPAPLQSASASFNNPANQLEDKPENTVSPQTDFPDDSHPIPDNSPTTPDLFPLVSPTSGSLTPVSTPDSPAIPDNALASRLPESRPMDEEPSNLNLPEGKTTGKKQEENVATAMETRLPMLQASLLAAFLPMDRSGIPAAVPSEVSMSEMSGSSAPISGNLLSALPSGFRNTGAIATTLPGNMPVFSLETPITPIAGQAEATQNPLMTDTSPAIATETPWIQNAGDHSGQSFHPLMDGVPGQEQFGSFLPVQPATQDIPMQTANLPDGLSSTLASQVLQNEGKPFASVPTLSSGIPLQGLSGLDQAMRALNGRVESVTSAPATAQNSSSSVFSTDLPANAAADAPTLSALSFEKIADETVDMLSITESAESPELSDPAGSPDLSLPGMMPASEKSPLLSSPGTAAPQTGKPDPFTSIAQNPVDQVADGAIHSLKNGHRELVIRLNPDNLGEVRINLVSNARHELSARLIADTPEGHAALTDQMDTLRRSLEAQGLQVERLSVMLAGQAESRSDSAQSGPHQGFTQQEHAKGNHQQPSFNAQDSSGSGQPGGNPAWTQQGNGGQPQYNRNAVRSDMQAPVDDRASGGASVQTQRNGGLAERRPDGGRVSILA